MGIVVSAHHLALDRRVAIKLMRPEVRARADLVRRFLREARAAARLNSRHVTRVFDVGTLADGAPYIVMELLDGISLGAWLKQRGPAPVPLAAAIVSQASTAIAEAHAAGVIHRDLKPANLFITRDCDGDALVKVLDLGVCKLVDATGDPADTTHSTALGTPMYMAPEQLGGARHADTRSDIWSLGVILYELITGRPPFHGPSLEEVRRSVTFDPVPAMDRGNVPCELEAVIARCLAKDPGARFQRVMELTRALAPFSPAVHRDAPGAIPLDRHTALSQVKSLARIGVAVALAVTGVVCVSVLTWHESAGFTRGPQVQPRASATPNPPGASPPSRQGESSAGSPMQRPGRLLWVAPPTAASLPSPARPFRTAQPPRRISSPAHAQPHAPARRAPAVSSVPSGSHRARERPALERPPAAVEAAVAPPTGGSSESTEVVDPFPNPD
jgi:serine/threonine protein kinase